MKKYVLALLICLIPSLSSAINEKFIPACGPDYYASCSYNSREVDRKQYINRFTDIYSLFDMVKHLHDDIGFIIFYDEDSRIYTVMYDSIIIDRNKCVFSDSSGECVPPDIIDEKMKINFGYFNE